MPVAVPMMITVATAPAAATVAASAAPRAPWASAAPRAPLTTPFAMFMIVTCWSCCCAAADRRLLLWLLVLRQLLLILWRHVLTAAGNVEAKFLISKCLIAGSVESKLIVAGSVGLGTNIKLVRCWGTNIKLVAGGVDLVFWHVLEIVVVLVLLVIIRDRERVRLLLSRRRNGRTPPTCCRWVVGGAPRVTPARLCRSTLRWRRQGPRGRLLTFDAMASDPPAWCRWVAGGPPRDTPARLGSADEGRRRGSRGRPGRERNPGRLGTRDRLVRTPGTRSRRNKLVDCCHRVPHDMARHQIADGACSLPSLGTPGKKAEPARASARHLHRNS